MSSLVALDVVFFVVVFWHPSGARWLVVTVVQERQVTILETFFFFDSP